MAPLPELLDVPQLAAELGRNKGWVYRSVESRGLPCIRVGRSVYFEREAVAMWLASLRAPANFDLEELAIR
jgi:excisionase family DNA binding protein